MISPVLPGTQPMVLFTAVPIPPEPTFAPSTSAECETMLLHLPNEVREALQKQHLHPIANLMELNVQIGRQPTGQAASIREWMGSPCGFALMVWIGGITVSLPVFQYSTIAPLLPNYAFGPTFAFFLINDAITCADRVTSETRPTTPMAGRAPEAVYLHPVTGQKERLEVVQARCTSGDIGLFGPLFNNGAIPAHKRVGIPGTLHRLSLITHPAKDNDVIAVTARVGRAMQGVVARMAPFLLPQSPPALSQAPGSSASTPLHVHVPVNPPLLTPGALTPYRLERINQRLGRLLAAAHGSGQQDVPTAHREARRGEDDVAEGACCGPQHRSQADRRRR